MHWLRGFWQAVCNWWAAPTLKTQFEAILEQGDHDPDQGGLFEATQNPFQKFKRVMEERDVQG